MLGQTASNMDPAARAWTNAVRIWQSKPENKGQPLPPSMQDPLTYAGTAMQQGKMSAEAGEQKVAAKTSFPEIDQTYQSLEQNVEWLHDPTHRQPLTPAI